VDLASAPACVLQMHAITKSYGSVLACDAVDLVVHRGEIHGLLGENGAGKSTLMKILLGLVHRDAGSIRYGGALVEINTPQVAATRGLGMVHQHLSIIERLRVWENVILGDIGRIDRADACRQVDEVGRRYGLAIDPMARVEDLSTSQRQRVELIKCLRRDPHVLILDEPTSALAEADSAELFSVLRRVVRQEGRAVILISHKLEEIAVATDRVTVLRKGRVVFHGQTRDITAAELARHMVGREVRLNAEAGAWGILPVGRHLTEPNLAETVEPNAPERCAALRVRDLQVHVGGVAVLESVNLYVVAGEIVGLYGVEGNGQSTLGDVLAGLIAPTGGSIELNGVPVDPSRPGALYRAGLGIVPEDRHRCALVLDMSVAENLSLKAVSGASFINRKQMYAHAQQLVADFNIAAPSLDAPVRSLSGGNQQRLVMARELSAKPTILVAVQPTQGLDVAAIEDLYQRLRTEASSGVAVLLISTDFEEITALCSRVAVISSGRITGELSSIDSTTQRLGMLVGGIAA
jgi:general nucleoside transport system ATP-binding protein